MHGMWDFFDSFIERPLRRFFVLLASIAGSCYGYYYYADQLSSSHVLYWLFIPDCPLFTTLFALALIAYSLNGWRSARFEAFVLFGLVKYGLWTMFVILWFREEYISMGTGAFQGALFSLHVGMVLLGMILVPGVWRKREDIKDNDLGLFLAFFLLCDAFDYVFLTHPPLPSTEIQAVALFSTLESLLLWGGMRRWLGRT